MIPVNTLLFTAFLIFTGGFIAGASISYEIAWWQVGLYILGNVLLVIKAFYEFRRNL